MGQEPSRNRWDRRADVAEHWFLLLTPVMLVTASGVADVLCSLTAILFIVRAAIKGDTAWLDRPWIRVLLLLWLYLCLRSAFSVQPLHSLTSAFIWLRFPVFAMAVSRCTRDPVFRNRLAMVTALSVLFLASDGLLQLLRGRDVLGHGIEPDGRLTGPFTRPRVGITVAWLFLPPLLWLVQAKRPALASALGVASLLVIAVSGERMALVTLLLDAVVLGLLLPTWRRGIAITAVGALVLMLIPMMLKPALLDRQLFSIWRTVMAVGDSTYGLIWTRAAHVAATHPIVGLGVDNYRVVCPNAGFGPLAGADNFPRCSTHPHNYYLEVFLAGGVIALAGFVTAVLLLFTDLCRRLDGDVLFAGLVATLAMRLFPLGPTTTFFSSWSAIPLFLYVGWAVSYLPERRSAQQTAPPVVEAAGE